MYSKHAVLAVLRYLRLVENSSSQSWDWLHLMKNSLHIFIVWVHNPKGSHVHLVVLEVFQVKSVWIKEMLFALINYFLGREKERKRERGCVREGERKRDIMWERERETER
jgi:hypothetical protein